MSFRKAAVLVDQKDNVAFRVLQLPTVQLLYLNLCSSGTLIKTGTGIDFNFFSYVCISAPFQLCYCLPEEHTCTHTKFVVHAPLNDSARKSTV